MLAEGYRQLKRIADDLERIARALETLVYIEGCRGFSDVVIAAAATEERRNAKPR